MTPAHRTDFGLRTELGGSRSKEKTPCGRLEPMIMDLTTSQHHDGTSRHGTGAHSLWKGVPAPGLKKGSSGAVHCY